MSEHLRRTRVVGPLFILLLLRPLAPLLLISAAAFAIAGMLVIL